MRDVVQAQTIENARLMRDGWANSRAERSKAMTRLMNDGLARRACLLPAVFTSL